jgi:ABC-type nitrate/sulfonate/bicarbonate transport system substrate-binding protein
MKNSSGHAKLCLAVSFVAVLLNSPSAMAAAKTQLRVAYSSISGSAIVTWIALDKGLFGKYDLDVELIYVAGSQAMQLSSAARRRSAFRVSSLSFASTRRVAIR